MYLQQELPNKLIQVNNTNYHNTGQSAYLRMQLYCDINHPYVNHGIFSRNSITKWFTIGFFVFILF